MGGIEPPAGRAHPRSRGENRDGVIDRLSIGGSSPLTRGKRQRDRARRGAGGLIPAHAGKTICVEITPQTGRAHPRSRGENWLGRLQLLPARGSSPLTRGKPASGPALGRGPGLIPAHAGKTCSAESRTLDLRAHPRSRGENVRGSILRHIGDGSSPLTRGKRMPGNEDIGALRLIPAHAGKTVSGALRFVVPGAHPRSRGENTVNRPTTPALTGSSPLTRGKRKPLTLADIKIGLIPAHAGKTP